ncbi:ABC transporter ATP-binding protein [Frigidibacter sp. MR17.24]|uniref:ABC transporter ATP-binding protein n=1 Tax=Frigidibacter sp. MR17.24 TaxID=3127345 RepID=UPI003012D8D2
MPTDLAHDPVPPAAGRDLLRVEDLAVTFPLLRGQIAAVRGTSLRVAPGKVTALVGESGSGKTVVSQTVLGLQPRAARVSGRILFDDGTGPDGPIDLLALPHDGRRIRQIRGARIGMIFQEPMTSFSPLHTIGDQVSEALKIHSLISPAERRERTEHMLARVGFPHPGRVFDMYPFELSGGMRQRAMIAMALICGPSLLIADEPTTALDVTIQAQILALIKDLQAETGLAVLLITHDLGVVANTADEVVVMHEGRVMEAGPVEDIFRRPAHPYLRGLMAALPNLEPGPPERLKPLREIAPGKLAAIGRIAARAEAPALPGHRAPGQPLVRVRDVWKSFLPRGESWRLFGSRTAPVPAVRDVSFDILRGECLGLVGESGSGKTTLGKMLVHAMRPDSGSITYEAGERTIDLAEATGADLTLLRTRAQLIFQDPVSSLSPRMSVGRILSEPLDIHRRGTPAERRETVAALLQAIGLPPGAAQRYPHSFSGGQRQRIGIARALALGPDFVVCDEPVSALDASVQAQILNMLKDLQKDLHLTYLFVSHNLAVVNYMADRIAVMWQGRLVEIAPRDRLMTGARHPYTQALLAAVPLPDLNHPLDVAAVGRAAGKPGDWPAAFREEPGAEMQMADIGDGHLVRMRAEADARELVA